MSKIQLKAGDIVKVLTGMSKNVGKIGVLRVDGERRWTVDGCEGCWSGTSSFELVEAAPAPVVEDPMTCELRVGDTVEVMLEASSNRGKQFKIKKMPDACGRFWVLEGTNWQYTQRSSLKLVARAGAPLITPVKPVVAQPPKPEDGVLPSDRPAVDAYVKRMLEAEFFGTGKKAPPAPQKKPNAGLLVITGEKYRGGC